MKKSDYKKSSSINIPNSKSRSQNVVKTLQKFPVLTVDDFKETTDYNAYKEAVSNIEPLKQEDFSDPKVFIEYQLIREEKKDCAVQLMQNDFCSDNDYQIYRWALIKNRLLNLTDFKNNTQHFQAYQEAMKKKMKVKPEDLRPEGWFQKYAEDPQKTSLDDRESKALSIDKKKPVMYSFNPEKKIFDKLSGSNTPKKGQNSLTKEIHGFGNGFGNDERIVEITPRDQNNLFLNPTPRTNTISTHKKDGKIQLRDTELSENKKTLPQKHNNSQIYKEIKGFDVNPHSSIITKKEDTLPPHIGNNSVNQTITHPDDDSIFDGFGFGNHSPRSINGIQEHFEDIVVKPLPEIDLSSFSQMTSHRAYLKARQKNEPLTEKDFISGSAFQNLPEKLLKNAFKEYQEAREKCQNYNIPLKRNNFSTDNNFTIYQNALIKDRELTLEDFAQDKFSFGDYCQNVLNVSYEEEEEEEIKKEEKSETKSTKISSIPINSNISTIDLLSDDRYDTPPRKSSVGSKFISKFPSRNSPNSFSPGDRDDKSWQKRTKNELEKQSTLTTPEWAKQQSYSSDSDDNTLNKWQINLSPNKSPRIDENTPPKQWQNNVRSPSKSPQGGIVIPN